MQEKKQLPFIVQYWWFILSFGAIVFSAIGITFQYFLLIKYGVNFFDYAEIDDFIIAFGGAFTALWAIVGQISAVSWLHPIGMLSAGIIVLIWSIKNKRGQPKKFLELSIYFTLVYWIFGLLSLASETATLVAERIPKCTPPVTISLLSPTTNMEPLSENWHAKYKKKYSTLHYLTKAGGKIFFLERVFFGAYKYPGPREKVYDYEVWILPDQWVAFETTNKIIRFMRRRKVESQNKNEGDVFKDTLATEIWQPALDCNLGYFEHYIE